MLAVEVLVSLVFDAFVLGVLFIKLGRPKHRNKSVKFSEVAVVDNRGEPPELQIRVAEVRRDHLVEPHVRLVLHEEIEVHLCTRPRCYILCKSMSGDPCIAHKARDAKKMLTVLARYPRLHATLCGAGP